VRGLGATAREQHATIRRSRAIRARRWRHWCGSRSREAGGPVGRFRPLLDITPIEGTPWRRASELDLAARHERGVGRGLVAISCWPAGGPPQRPRAGASAGDRAGPRVEDHVAALEVVRGVLRDLHRELAVLVGTYTLEAKRSLNDMWESVDTRTGAGGETTLLDAAANEDVKFYRIRVE